MPLSKTNTGYDIKELMKTGRPKRQAVAIALRVTGKAKPKTKKKRKPQK